MKQSTKTALGIAGGAAALAGIAGLLYSQSKKTAPIAAAPAAVVPPPPAPKPAPIPEVHVSPSAPSYQDVPPEQWTQEQASQATSDAGNQARDAVGKLFGF